MAVVTRTNLKSYFQSGDKPNEAQFIDLIDSFVHIQEGDDNKQITDTLKVSGSETYISASSNALLGMVVSGSILPGDTTSDLGSPTQVWQHLFLSQNSLQFVSQSGEITRVSQDDAKQVFEGRKAAAGMAMKRVRGFTSASTFIDLEATNITSGDRIDIKVADTFEALSISTARTSLGPKETVPLELTGSLKVRPSHADPHELKGKYNFKGNPDNFGTAGSGVVIQDAVFFNDEGGIVPQPGIISQSLNIGTSNSPSVNVMEGVGENCTIEISEGTTVSVNEGSLFKILCPQPSILTNPDDGSIIFSDPDEVGPNGDFIIYNNNNGNPSRVLQNTTIPAGQVSHWTVGAVNGTYTQAANEVISSTPSDNDLDAIGIQIGASLGVVFEGISINNQFVDNFSGTGNPDQNIKLRIEDGAVLHVQNVQPDITVSTETDEVTLSNGTGNETSFTTGQFGTNPQYIPMHMVVPGNNIAIWYGPIYIGRGYQNFSPVGNFLNLDEVGQGQNASLRLHEGAKIKIQSF